MWRWKTYSCVHYPSQIPHALETRGIHLLGVFDLTTLNLALCGSAAEVVVENPRLGGGGQVP